MLCCLIESLLCVLDMCFLSFSRFSLVIVSICLMLGCGNTPTTDEKVRAKQSLKVWVSPDYRENKVYVKVPVTHIR